ncbi:MAG: hypothetical protein IPJ32_12435 [Sphingobacteriaceae bacterium]|nr:hypothetical protein [Sphingobacteriaceae bacterium]
MFRKGITSINVNVYDYDEEGLIRIISVAKRVKKVRSAKAPNWESSSHKIVPEELNTSLDVQFIKKKPVKNNNITVFIVNQYGENLAFYAVPIGGVPKYNYKIKVTK